MSSYQRNAMLLSSDSKAFLPFVNKCRENLLSTGKAAFNVKYKHPNTPLRR